MVENKISSREHHWWPVGLQAYWSVLGTVNHVDISDQITSKKYYNRKIAKKSHGHTIMRDSVHWRYNFEDDFQEADNVANEVVSSCLRLFPFSKLASILWMAFKIRFKRRLNLIDSSRTFAIDGVFRRKLILVCISLLIRSPANRHKLERTGAPFGLPQNEETGKMNILNQVRLMKESYERGFSSNIFPIVIFSLRKEFIFGDGLLDSMTAHAPARQFRGHAIIPLTPHICVFLSCPTAMRSDRNARILFAPERLVDEINEITQVYSRNQLFFSTQKPRLIDAFLINEHRMYEYDQNSTVKELLAMSGERLSSRGEF